jgi:hypothetical protein
VIPTPTTLLRGTARNNYSQWICPVRPRPLTLPHCRRGSKFENLCPVSGALLENPLYPRLTRLLGNLFEFPHPQSTYKKEIEHHGDRRMRPSLHNINLIQCTSRAVRRLTTWGAPGLRRSPCGLPMTPSRALRR